MIRRATSADAPVLAALEAAAFGRGVERPWSVTAIADWAASSGAIGWVAERGESIVGWVAFRRVLDEAELLRVAVDPRSRRRGVGRRLVERGLSTLRDAGVAVVHLEVSDGNAAALVLYRRLGFELVGRRSGYFSGGVDALLLRREG